MNQNKDSLDKRKNRNISDTDEYPFYPLLDDLADVIFPFESLNYELERR